MHRKKDWLMESKEKKDTGGLKAFYWRQVAAQLWMFAGIAGAMTLREVLPWLKENVSYASMLLIGGVLGTLVPNLVHFGQAGKVITKGENPTTNFLVGTGATLLLFVLVVVVLTAIFFE